MKKKIFYDANDNLDANVCTGAELMDGLSNTVRTISRDHDTDVIFAGEGALTNGEFVVLPSIKQDVEITKREANVMLGYGGHESLHKLLTDFKRMPKYFDKWRQGKMLVTKHMNNAIEDVRIENGGGVLYNGMHKSIDQTAEEVNKKYLEVLKDDPSIATSWARVMPVAVTWAGRKALGYATPLNQQCLDTLPPDLRKQAEKIAKRAMALDHGVTGMGTVDQKRAYNGCIAGAKLAEKVVKEFYSPEQQKADEEERERQREQWQQDNPGQGQCNPGQGTPNNGGADGTEQDEEDGGQDTQGNAPNGGGTGDEGNDSEGGSQGDDDDSTTGEREVGEDEDDAENTTEGDVDEDTEQDEQSSQGSDEQDQGDDSEDTDSEDGSTGQDGNDDGSEDSGKADEDSSGNEPDGDQSEQTGQDEQTSDEIDNSNIENQDGDDDSNGYGATRQEEPDWSKIKAEDVEEEQNVFDPNLNQIIEELAEAVNSTARSNHTRRVFAPSGDVIATRHTHSVLNNHPDYKKKYEHEKKRVSSTLGTIRRVLERVLIAQDQTNIENGKRTGKLDLKRNSVAISQFKRNVFTKKVDESFVNSAVTLLNDCSGSMNGSKLRLAAQCSMSIAEALEPLGIPLEVLGHTTTDGGPAVRAQMDDYWGKHYRGKTNTPNTFSRLDNILLWVFKSFDEALATCRSGLGFMYDASSGANADPDAIIMSAKRLLDRPEDKKILLVLSDGHPAFSSEFEDQDQQTRDAVEWCIQQGILIVGIGIKDDSVRAYYPKYVICNNLDELPTTVINELRNLLLSTKKYDALINASKTGVKSIA